MRAPGFYWIVLEARWTVGQFDGRLWWAPGLDLPVEPDHVGPKIERTTEA